MKMHYVIRRIAGSFVLASVALGYWVSPYFYLFTAFVGFNLLQSSFTRWCLMESMPAKIGIGREQGGRARMCLWSAMRKVILSRS